VPPTASRSVPPPIDELAGWLEKREGRPVALLGASFEPAPAHDEALSEQLRRQLNHRMRTSGDSPSSPADAEEPPERA
jgi:hypothetical protein